MRHPDEIMTDFDAAVKGQADIDPREILHEIIADILDTAGRDLRSRFDHSVAGRPMVTPVQINEHLLSVQQYVTNFYGDD